METKRYWSCTPRFDPFATMGWRWNSLRSNTTFVRLQLPKKVRRLALRSALSSKVANNEFIVLEGLTIDAPKTKDMIAVFAALSIERKVLVVTADYNESVVLSTRNIPGVTVVDAAGVNVLDLVAHDKVIITKDAVARVEEVLA